MENDEIFDYGKLSLILVQSAFYLLFSSWKWR